MRKAETQKRGVLYSAGLAAVQPVQPKTTDPKASTHLNTGLAAFRPAQKKKEDPAKSTTFCTGSAECVDFPLLRLDHRRTPVFVVIASLGHCRPSGRRHRAPLFVVVVPPSLIGPKAGSF